MPAYLLRRAALAALFVLLVSSLALVLVSFAPGDYATDLVGGIGADPAQVAAARAREGLDRPLAEQYATWLGRVLRFDFGRSLLYRRPVAELVRQRAANTAILALAALALATALGVPLGVLSGSGGGGRSGRALIRGASVLFLSAPPLLMVLVLVFAAARTGWFPVGGMTTAGVDAGIAGAPDWTSWMRWTRDVAWHLPVPTLALALPMAAMIERLIAQSMAETIGAPFILSARARGVPRGRLVWRHALRVALRPVAAVYGLIIGTLLGGSFMVEIVTAWPGLGRLTYDALRGRDVFLVAGCAAAGALFLALGSLVSDAAQAWLEPGASEMTR